MKEISDIVEATAKAYYLSYKCLIAKHIEVSNFYNDSYSAYFVPAITTAAFSCELALKNIRRSECGKIPKGHDLKKLFYQINETTRKDITYRTIQTYNLKSEILNAPEQFTEQEFENSLVLHKDTFVTWRYFYEGFTNTDVDFLEAFMFCLNDEEQSYGEYVLNQLALRDYKS
ncbi:hypothetical protein KDC22_23615 [Paenibacillus tritici]|uniref:hypothetical protein n=1 Tax=Paenibacillus tritici TaxID=1873425 RepID=UPI001BA8516D|nr:hypothetical protein [Paenibacillus tritici]QUL53366.1 hypothetical protein KDC22_23615 [Paenibacillus tritici]